jgi:hypothetical protein
MLAELFLPYSLFISFFITVIINIWLISKQINWVLLLAGNLLVILILEFVGLSEYSFLNQIVEFILDTIKNIISYIGTAIFGGSTAGGGGGGTVR